MMKENQFYCVKCHKKVEIPASEVHLTMIKNRKTGSIPALVGKHKACGTKCVKFVKREKVASLRSRKSRRSKRKSGKKSKSKSKRKSKSKSKKSKRKSRRSKRKSM